MCAEHMFVTWSCKIIKVGFRANKTGLSPPVVYTSVRSKTDILILIIFVVIIALRHSLYGCPMSFRFSCCNVSIVVIVFKGCSLCFLMY